MTASEEDLSAGSGNVPASAASQGDYVAPTAPPEAGKEDIEAAVKALLKEYTDARTFDQTARQQFARDRRYAAGTADIAWAVDANLIGSFIDILCSTLYARDPDVSARKAQQVDNTDDTADGLDKMELFAKTAEIVVSRLWKDARMKKAARKCIRSVLSVGQGWLKVLFLTEKIPQPTTESALNDAQALFNRLTATDAALAPGADPTLSDDQRAVKVAEVTNLKASLEAKIEKSVRKMLTIDTVSAQDIQVSLDVACTEDYLDANWIANAIFVPTKSIKETCPTLTDAEVQQAKKYFQRRPRNAERNDNDLLTPLGSITAESADSYVTTQEENQTEPFAKIIELWDRRDMHVKTMIEGVKVWAKDPYTPPYATSRFYPYFRTAFYEVDDARQPQSLSYRLAKLQDEYSCSRSNFRLARERSITGVIFNSTQVDDEQMKKMSASKQQEYVGIKAMDPTMPIQNLFAPKPVGAFDPRIFDNTSILSDMDRISGVQQAMQQAAATAQPKTATEASIEQAGASSRTGTDRDLVETMLSDVARYTTECALQSLTNEDVVRIAGPASYWPYGMNVDDLTTLVEISIEAGTTGKPRNAGDQAAWIQALPILKEGIIGIHAALATGDESMAKALTEVIKETLVRLGDTTDIERFIPKAPPPSDGAPPPKVSISLKGDLSPAAALAASGLAPPPGSAPPGGPAPLPLAAPDGAAGGGPDLSSAMTHNPSVTIEHAPAPEHHVDNSIHLHVKPETAK